MRSSRFVNGRRRLATLLTLLLTGAGHLLVGRSKRGVVLLALYSMILVSLIRRPGLLLPLYPMTGPAQWGPLLGLIALFGVGLLLAFVDIRAQED